MSDQRINPQHDVSRWAEDNWQMLVAMAMHMLGVDRLEITTADAEAFALMHPDPALIVDSKVRENVIVLEIVTRAEAVERAAQEAE